MRAGWLVAAVAALACLAPTAASALDECRGLQQCVSVVGPWVVVPARADGGLVAVSWELRCPVKGYVIGGTDARATSRLVEVSFRAERGSPVSPGISTRDAALFTGRAASPGGPFAFRPAIGCLPGRGGGGRSQTAVGAARAVVPPGTPLLRRVVTATVRAGVTTTVVARCPARTRLVDAGHAVAFPGAAPPTAAAMRAVRATRSTTAGTVRVQVASPARVVAQAQALCARGGS